MDKRNSASENARTNIEYVRLITRKKEEEEEEEKKKKKKKKKDRPSNLEKRERERERERERDNSARSKVRNRTKRNSWKTNGGVKKVQLQPPEEKEDSDFHNMQNESGPGRYYVSNREESTSQPAVEEGWSPTRMHKLQGSVSFPCDALRNAQTKILAMDVSFEATVFSAAVIENICREILERASSLAENGGAKEVQRKGKYDQLNSGTLILAIWKSDDLRLMCEGTSRLSTLLSHYLDDRTAKALSALGYGNGSASTRNSTRQDQSRTEKQQMWERRRDDVISDSDLARLLMHVNPTHGLTNDARMFLLVFVREIVGEILEGVDIGQVRVRENTCVTKEDFIGVLASLVPGRLGLRVQKLGLAAVDRYNLKSAEGKAVRIQFKAQGGATWACRYNKSAPLGRLLNRACSKLHVEEKTTVFVFGGRRVDKAISARGLGMSAGEDSREYSVFAFPAKWWQHKQRANARRGLLVSGKEKDVGALLSRVQSKVDHKASPQLLGASSSPSRKRRSKLRHHREQGSRKLPDLSSSGGNTFPEKEEPQLSPLEKQRKKVRGGLRKPKKYRFSKHYSDSINRLISTPKNGESVDFSAIDNLPSSSPPSGKGSRSKPRYGYPSRKHRHLKKGQGKRGSPKHQTDQTPTQLDDDTKNIQSGIRGARARKHWMQNKIAKREQALKHARELRRQKFRTIGSSALRDAEKAVDAWMKFAQYTRFTRDWVTNDKSLHRTMEDEEQECFRKARHLKQLLQEATGLSKRLQTKVHAPIDMLVRWNDQIPAEVTSGIFEFSHANGEDLQVENTQPRLPEPMLLLRNEETQSKYLKSSISLPRLGTKSNTLATSSSTDGINNGTGKRVSFSNTVQVAR